MSARTLSLCEPQTRLSPMYISDEFILECAWQLGKLSINVTGFSHVPILTRPWNESMLARHTRAHVPQHSTSLAGRETPAALYALCAYALTIMPARALSMSEPQTYTLRHMYISDIRIFECAWQLWSSSTCSFNNSASPHFERAWMMCNMFINNRKS